MPYVSNQQRKFFHTATAAKAGITPAMVKEYDTASKGLTLPSKIKSKAGVKRPKAK